MRCKQQFDRLVIKEGLEKFVEALFLLLLGFTAILLILTEGFSKEFSQPKSLGALFGVILFFLLALMGAWLLALLVGYEIIIDSKGICERRILPLGRRASFQWSEIGDWGYTFVGKQRVYRGVYRDSYVFYFADIKLPMQEKNCMEKKVDGDCIFFNISKAEIKTLCPIISEYCRSFTNIEPFRSRHV